MLRYNMPFYLFTFRPQISEQQLFEDFFTILKPELDTLSKYSYTIEEDNTLQKHIHLLAESKAKDLSAFKQIFQKKIFKDFKSTLKNKMTNEKGFDDRKVKETPEDLQHTLGYVNKEAQALRRQYKGFTNEEITNAVEYYHVVKRIKSENVQGDLKIMTSRNIHIYIKDYCERNKIEPNQLAKLKMIKENHAFSQCPKVDETFKEVEIMMFPERFPDVGEENSYDNIYYENLQYKSELERLKLEMKQLKKHYNLQDVRTTFSGVVQIRGKGSDEDYINI